MKSMQLCIYESDDVEALMPLVQIRPVFSLVLGAKSLLERTVSFFSGAQVSVFCRGALADIVKERYSDLQVQTLDSSLPTLFLDARVVVNAELVTQLLNGVHGDVQLYYSDDLCIGAYFSKPPQSFSLYQEAIRSGAGETCSLKGVNCVVHVWQLLAWHKALLMADLGATPLVKEAGVQIEDYVYLDTTKGPIYLSEGVYVEAGTRLEGPLFVGPHASILGGKIKASVIGAHCKVAGEVSESVFSAYSNKAHAGYVGNSYIGEWVNLGAGTTTSNLKNTYGAVSLERQGHRQDTGMQFLGSIMGDYVKTGIGTLLNTGTCIGLGASIWGAALHQKDIPDFAWGESGQYTTIRLDKLLDMAEKMRARRQRVLSQEGRYLIENIYKKKMSVV